MVVSTKIVMTELVHEAFKGKCHALGLSMNEVVNTMIIRFVETKELDYLLDVPEDFEQYMQPHAEEDLDK